MPQGVQTQLTSDTIAASTRTLADHKTAAVREARFGAVRWLACGRRGFRHNWGERHRSCGLKTTAFD
ncbi:hypothetical protein WJX72_010601 [[Myrmecia] bisecta]|uniref:Uncharacterized protein n=1 Tax=[Myrmecia] bisecta TaxID=41462 RepID=A0AAW1PXR3_9CHLO